MIRIIASVCPEISDGPAPTGDAAAAVRLGRSERKPPLHGAGMPF